MNLFDIATTNDPNVYKVVLMWLNSANKVEMIKSGHVEWDGSSYLDGKKVWVASSACIPYKIDDWDMYATP